MKLSLLQFNKILLGVFLVSLLFKKGDVYSSITAQASKIILFVLVLSTIIYLLKNRKIIEFLHSIPKKIRFAIGILTVGVIIGWLVTLYVVGIPLSMPMVTEFITLLISFGIFSLVIFYTKTEDIYADRYLYALLVPCIYILFLIIPEITEKIHLVINGRFFGFTDNENVLSKIVLVPAIYFITSALFENKNKLFKILAVAISSGLVAILLWNASRGALLSLFLTTIFIFYFNIKNDFTFKNFIYKSALLLGILVLGFLITPHSGKQVVLNRILNKDTAQVRYVELKEQSIDTIISSAVSEKKVTKAVPETRTEIWSFYLKTAILNPLGLGPAFNTYKKAYISAYNDYITGGAHNSYLEIWLWGGIIGLAAFCYIILTAFRSVLEKIKLEPTKNNIALLAILVALSIALLFDSDSKLYIYWVILALCIRPIQQKSA